MAKNEQWYRVTESHNGSACVAVMKDRWWSIEDGPAVCRWDRIDGARTIRSVNNRKKQSAMTMDAEGLKEGIGYMPMDGNKESVAWTTGTWRRTLIVSMDAREEDEDLVYKQATTTKEFPAVCRCRLELGARRGRQDASQWKRNLSLGRHWQKKNVDMIVELTMKDLSLGRQTQENKRICRWDDNE